jgi:hypothetical protein
MNELSKLETLIRKTHNGTLLACDAQEILVLMAEKIESLLGEREKLKKLNSQLIKRVVEERFANSGELTYAVDMMAQNLIDYENEVYEISLCRRLRGSFEHECPF